MKIVAIYRPKPNTVWFATLLMQFLIGVGVLDEAMPGPIAGCMTSKGTTTAPMSTESTDSKPGLLAHANPYMHTSRLAKAMPVG
jgi:hypothetical protein